MTFYKNLKSILLKLEYSPHEFSESFAGHVSN